MKLTRSDKEEIVSELKDLMEENQVVGVLDMQDMPAKQLQQIKKDLKDTTKIKMARKTLINIAIDNCQEDGVKEGIEDIKDNDAKQPALLFSNKNPFKLYKKIKESKSPAPASGGEKAPHDVKISDGSTGLGPGPMIGELQKVGADVQVEDNQITVQEEVTAVEQGKTISKEIADILNKLDIKPLEVGLDLKLVHEDGEVFDKSILDVDRDQYRKNVEQGVGAAFNLSVNLHYFTLENKKVIVQEAFLKALNLAINANINVEESIEDLLSKVSEQADQLRDQLDN